MRFKVDVAVVDGDEETLVPESGLDGVASGQVSGGPVRSGNQEGVRAGVIVRDGGVGGGRGRGHGVSVWWGNGRGA